MKLDKWTTVAQLRDLAVTQEEVDEFLRSRVWLAIRVGVARTLSSAYAILKDRTKPENELRHAQGIIEGLEWLFTAAENVDAAEGDGVPGEDIVDLELAMRELLDGTRN